MPQVLIVDDEQNVASSLALLLQRPGYATTIAPDGRTALEAVRSTTFDLALLDLNLGDPLMDGLAVCREIRAQPVYVPVIMLTVRDSSTDKVIGLEMGADDYMTKPFDEREFTQTVQAAIEQALTLANKQERVTLFKLQGLLTLLPFMADQTVEQVLAQ